MSSNPVRPAVPERILQRLEWTVIRRLDGLLQGDYRTFFQGMGLDFSDLRAYQFGDDVRTIDWNATARLREPHVRRYREDRNLEVWFLVDTSPSLDFGSSGRLKRDLAVEVVGVLARLLSRNGNRIGACVYDGNPPRLFPPLSGRNAVLAIISALLEKGHPPATPETDLGILLDAMAGVMRHRSLVFIVSDFFSAPGWEALLGPLGRRHEIQAIRVHDPLESVLPQLGTLWFEDAETGGQILVDTRDRHFTRRLARMAAEREAALARGFRKAGIDSVGLSTTDDLTGSLLAWAARRRFQKTRSGGKLS